MMRPIARPASIRARHKMLIGSMIGMILLPLALVMAYLFVVAEDQYASNTGFTVRQEDSASASDLLGGLSQFVGSSSGGNTDVLFEFIQSQEIVEEVQADIDLIGHYSQNWPRDAVFSIWPDATIEDLLWFWTRMVRVSYDRSSGLMDVQVRAHDPQVAQDIALRIVAESESMINALNATARRDTTINAERDLEVALERLRLAREAVAVFRARTQIVDPQADIQGRMGVLSNLQQQLAQALVEFDLLLQNTSDSDPRTVQARRRIEAIRARIEDERRNFTEQDVTVDGTNYPDLLARYEGLRVDQEFAEQTYRAALTALDQARSNAQRQTLYLATYIRPTLAQRPQYPERWVLTGLTFMFLTMIWTVAALVYYSIRDRG
ncbi:sugar transporter [Roseicitreum antarcticum]|uniref:Capsular polysaccharide transport system permease protein n=1 Tax=Roseicitreum antarcticum TaxID=564137 RepID=A0A1H3ETD5_9RHOB|nr:sugar transporter [Roseicitreum antarcticum]SDX82022.1 capsular polysaccharide transport system permease protein [Roseicitreum antarcticum]